MKKEKFVSVSFIKWLNKNYTNAGSTSGTFTRIGRWVEIGDLGGKSYTTMQLHAKYKGTVIK